MAIKTVTLKDGRVAYDIYVNVTGPHGRAQSRRRYATLREAREGETLVKAQMLLDKGKPTRVTWSMWLDKTIRDMRVTHRPSTLGNYTTTITRWTEHWNDRLIAEITTADVHEAIYRPEHVKPGTRRTALDILKRMFARAVEQGVLVRNPATPIKVKVPQSPLKALNSVEVDTLLREAMLTNHRFYPIWAAALFTGMRSGELYALKWTDVDFTNRRIFVSRSWHSKAGYGPTKNQRNRVIPISDDLMKLLGELKLDPSRQLPGHEEFVLPHLPEWTKGEQAMILRAFCRLIGVTSVRFHDLRATFITEMLLKNVSSVQVMAIVGHSDLKTTNAYVRITGADLEGATEALSYSLPEAKLAEVINLRP